VSRNAPLIPIGQEVDSRARESGDQGHEMAGVKGLGSLSHRCNLPGGGG